jgi:CheY-like chemotaxis protein
MKKRVLLAEDNDAAADVMQKQLMFLGYDVLVARTGVEAVTKAVEELPDVIVMDIQMPVMDGLQAAAQLRKDSKTQSIPILAATAKALSGDKERCMAAGCDDYIAKPFTHVQLGAMIQKLLNLPRN